MIAWGVFPLMETGQSIIVRSFMGSWSKAIYCIFSENRSSHRDASFVVTAEVIITTSCGTASNDDTGTKMSSFWRNFSHCCYLGFQCSQWWKCHQNEDISVSVKQTTADSSQLLIFSVYRLSYLELTLTYETQLLFVPGSNSVLYDWCMWASATSYTSWTWWRHQMETFSALLAICVGNSPVLGEFPAQRPVTRSFDVFFDLYLN